jgi:hypothetical protein
VEDVIKKLIPGLLLVTILISTNSTPAATGPRGVTLPESH